MAVLLGLQPMNAQTEINRVIDKQPDGIIKSYERAGYAYYTNDGYVRRGAQTGTINIVYGKDGNVYLQNPLSKLQTETWVKANINDDSTQITLPLGQAIYYDTNMNDSIVLALMDFDEDYEEFYEDTNAKTVTYTVNNEQIKLEGTSRYKVMAAMWATSKIWADAADYETKYTLKMGEDTLVSVPEGLAVDKYKLKARSYITENPTSYSISIGFEEKNAYIQGIFSEVPDAWIKGIVNGNTLTFPKGQFLGKTYDGKNAYYMIATNHQNTSEIQDFVLTYDEETQQYSSDQFLVLNTTKNTVYLMEALDSIKIYKNSENGVYTIPYTDAFDAGLNDYTIIDNNNDKVTWIANSLSKTAEYNWSMKAADDWLITPAIHLEAGKTYSFSIDVRGFVASFPERFEIKLGEEATAEAMGTTIIKETLVESGDMSTYTGEVKIDQDGNYYFGIHAISDADNMALTVDNIVITESEIPSGIDKVIFDNSPANVYTIDGRLVQKNVSKPSNLPKGIYIYKGKKIIIL